MNTKRLGGLGRIYKHDPRDDDFHLTAPLGKTSRQFRYWNGGHILDQGQTVSCIGQAFAEWLDIRFKQFLDPRGIYELAQRLETGGTFDPEAGTTVRAGAKLLKKLGFIERYHWAHKSIDALIHWLLEVGPAVIGVNWYEGMDEPTNGVDIHPTGKLRGGHGILADGVDKADGVIRLRQSWGPDVGTNGHLHIAIDDVKQLMREDGEVLLAVERRPQVLLAGLRAA